MTPEHSQITNKLVSVRNVNFMRLDLCYGIWQAEQDNVLKAKDDLEKVRLICRTDCRAYQMLKNVIDGRATY